MLRNPDRRTLAALTLGTLASLLLGQGFRERVSVELVRVEVLATDAKGHPISGLGASDFRVAVDGRTIPIDGFEPPAGGAPAAATPLPAGPAAAAATPSADRPQAAGVAKYFLAVLVDETSSAPWNRQAAYLQLVQFFRNPPPSDTRVLLMRFNGALSIECPWTSDVERVRKGLAALSRRGITARLGPPGVLAGGSEGVAGNPALDTMEAAAYVRSSLGGVFDALRVFPEGSGRKALFVVTDGALFLAPSEIASNVLATTTTAVSPSEPDAKRRAALELDRDRDLLLDSLAWNRTRSDSLMVDIERQALVRGIEIHPVRSSPHDLGGRISASRGGASFSNSIDPGSLREGGQVTPPLTDIAAGQSMEEVAEKTGGEAVLSRRLFEDRLRDEISNRDAVYVVSFRDPFPGDRRFHEIEISSIRPDVRLRHRRGYRVLDVREALIQKAANRLYFAADENPLGVRIAVEPRGVEKGYALADVTVAYPPPPQAGGEPAGPGAVSVIGFCAVRQGRLSEPIDLSGSSESVFSGQATWLVRTGRVRLRPGAYRWSFAVRDEKTGVTSCLTFDRRLP